MTRTLLPFNSRPYNTWERRSSHSIRDLHTALELINIAETRITDEEAQALRQVIAVLCDCIQRTTVDTASIELTRKKARIGGHENSIKH